MNSKSLKVLHIIDGFGIGGAETWLVNCVKYLNANPEIRLHFDFLATSGEEKILDQEVIACGSKIHYIKYSLKCGLRFRKDFRMVLKRNNYDVIHSHLDFVTGWHLLFGIGSLPPLRISHLHNPYNFVNNYCTSFARRLSYQIGRFLMSKLATHITGTSNSVMDEYGYNRPPFVAKRIRPLYCGFPANDFVFNPKIKSEYLANLQWDNNFVGLFVGRIGTHDHRNAKNQKNPSFAFEVAKTLVATHSNWRFLFVGYKGPLGLKMERELHESNLTDKIKFLGLRQDVSEIMSMCDVLLFPSHWEGLGMVAVEAQASGLEVLMSESVPSEAVIDSKLVHRLSLDNSIEDWVNTLVTISPKQNVQRGNAYLKFIKSDFSVGNSVSNLARAYQKTNV
jgi:glycosyltransferase involved in cell wall biosynthesis